MNAQELIFKVLEFLQTFLKIIYWYAEALFRRIVPLPMKSIDGEIILVTGAVGGIGKEICKHLVRSGSNIKLVLWDLNLPDLEKVAKELQAIGNGVKVFPFAVDISTRENIEISSKLVKDTVGDVTIVFNNAGIAPNGNFLQLTNTQVEKTMQINLMSHMWILREFLPAMVLKNHGRIVNICSMGGLKAAPCALPYFSSKFGVNGYSEALKMELELWNHDGIHVSTVYPYFVQTPLIKSLKIKDQNNTIKTLNRFFEPSEVGKGTVEGMRREQEYIYFPSTIPIFCFLEYLLPMKLRKSIQQAHKDAVVFKNAEENKVLTNSFLVTVKSNANKKD